MRGARKSRKQKETYRKLKLIAQFIVVFNLLALPMYLVMYYDWAWTGLQNSVAFVSSGILKLLGYENTLSGHEIFVAMPYGTHTIEVSWDSSGWKTVYAMFALIVATPTVKLETKLRYLAIFLPAVFVINIMRVVTTIGISISFGFGYFDLVHLFLWRYLLIGTILTLWLVYVRKENIIGIKA